jgi:hypothetical protein
MISSGRNVMLLLMLSIAGFNIVADGFGFPSKRTVKITNDVGNGLDVTVHCKSKDDDLGAHKLKPNGVYEFGFRPNSWGTSKYFCHFEWNNQVHWVDIYDYGRDKDKCRVCLWKIRPKKACIYDYKNKNYDLCYLWYKK